MSTLVASCILVLTGKALGMEWLSAPIFGVPSGFWAVGMAMLFAQYRHQRRLELMSDEQAGLLSARLDVSRMSLASLKDRMPTADHVTGVLEMVGVPSASWNVARKRINDLSAKIIPAQQATLRIGIDLCDADREALVCAGEGESLVLSCGVPIEWVKAPSGLIADAERDLTAGAFDALIRRERRGDINLFIPETPKRPAAWYDWSMPMPLGYASVFPPRVDAARVTLSGCELGDDRTALTAVRMVLACAMLGRTSPRTGSSRRFLGRTELPQLAAPGGPIDMLMMRLGDGIRGREGKAGASGVFKAAARAVGAWMTRSECGLDEQRRLELTLAAAEWLGDEPESALRSAAMLFATGQTDEAHDCLTRACNQLRTAGRRCESDPLAFIMSEVELGEPGRTTLGRIAAGIGLLWATSPETTIAYLRDDLMDDLSHAGWLSNRAGDVQVLQGVVDALQRLTGPSGSVRAKAA